MAPFAGHLRCAARLTLLAACGLTAAALAAGCGSTTHTLRLTVNTGLGPKPHAWTIGVGSTGSGSAVAGLVLTYPNGHKSQRSDFLLHDTGGSRAILWDLSSGTYGYRVYAVKVGSNVQSVIYLPAGDLVAKNLIASGTFTIPASGHDPFSGTWKSTSTGAILKIVRSGGGWTITDSKGHTGRAVVRGNKLVSDGNTFKRDGSRLAIYVGGFRIMEFLRK